VKNKDHENRLIEGLIRETRELKQDIYVQERVQEKLFHAKKEWEQTFDAIPDIVAVIDKHFIITKANKALAEKLGMKREDLIGKQCHSVIHGTVKPPDYCPHFNALSDDREHFAEVFEKNLNGHYLFSATPLKDNKGDYTGVVEIARDITEQKTAEDVLKASEARARAISDSSMDAIIVIDGKGVITYFNHAAEKMFGYRKEEVMGRELHSFLVSRKARDEYYRRLPGFEETGQCIVIGKTIELNATKKDGTNFPIELSISAFVLNGEWHSAGTIRDITGRKKMEEKLLKASVTDQLTGLLNRWGFFTLAEKQYEIAKRNRGVFSILFMDLNNLKTINDRFGHKAGDQALMDMAKILKETFRAADIIARMGGDEFTVFITDHNGAGLERAVMRHLHDNLKTFNEQEKREYKLSVSSGFAHFDPERPSSIDELMSRADELMYENKKHRKLEE